MRYSTIVYMSFFKPLKNYEAFCSFSENAKVTFSFPQTKIIEIKAWLFCEIILSMTKDDMEFACIITESLNIAKNTRFVKVPF